MAGCGYVCPLCEGKSFDEHGERCSWCNPDNVLNVTGNSVWKQRKMYIPKQIQTAVVKLSHALNLSIAYF